jgi:hypothetical protein
MSITNNIEDTVKILSEAINTYQVADKFGSLFKDNQRDKRIENLDSLNNLISQRMAMLSIPFSKKEDSDPTGRSNKNKENNEDEPSGKTPFTKPPGLIASNNGNPASNFQGNNNIVDSFLKLLNGGLHG